MIVAPVKIPELTESVNTFEEAKTIILENLFSIPAKLPEGTNHKSFEILTKYYPTIINRKILDRSPYPLDCKFIRNLFFKFEAKDINEFGKKLEAIENAHGKDFLENIFEEARGETGVELTQKLSSLQAEINCAYLLTPFGTLKKLIDVKGCDFIFQNVDKKWCIQIKRKNNEFHNLCLIADAISSELYIRDNNILRKFTRVSFEGEDIPYRLRSGIIDFIHSDLFMDMLNKCSGYSKESIKYHEDSFQFKNILIKVMGYENWMEYIFKYKDKQTNINFLKKHDKFQHYGLKNPGFYPDEENLQIDKLINSLENIIKEAKAKFEDCLTGNPALFIQLDVSPQNETNLNNKLIEIKNIIEEKQYEFPIVILPFSWFGRFRPILNRAAENSIFNQICQRERGCGKEGRTCVSDCG